MELPNDLRTIALKYAGRCQSCEDRLYAGEQAHWSPSSQKIWCIDCIPGDTDSSQDESNTATTVSQNGTTQASRNHSNPSTSTDDKHIPWRQLCELAQRCIEAEAAKSLVQYVERDSLWFLHPDEEKLVVGQTDSTEAPRGLANKLGIRPRSIIYGWPTIVLIDRNQKAMVATLFTVPVEAERSSKGDLILHANMEPEFNLAITGSGIFDPSVTEDINDLLSDGLPFGDADAFVALAEKTADLLGLPILSPLNARNLETNIDCKQGVYNAAISVVTDWSGYTSTLRAELRQLRSRKDWPTTAAAHLLPDSFIQKKDQHSLSEPLAAPLACNRSQEEILERFRKDPLTVVTGPPGTGKTQLVVNAVTNAWLDGDKVLVTSTNNGAVDVAVDRAEEGVSRGMLIRTGNRSVRAQVPNRITVATSQAAACDGNQAEARAQLKRVATKRAQLMKKIGRLEELDLKLLDLVKEQEELSNELKQSTQTLWALEYRPELPISSRLIERRARRLSRTWLLPRFRARRLRRLLRCLENAPVENLADWANLDQCMTELNSQLETEQAERKQLESEIGDPSSSVAKADHKWMDASLSAIRAETATLISSGGGNLAVFGNIPANVQQFRRAVTNSFPHVRGWACTALTAHSNFPLESGLFDLVIIDEASQCSLAAVLPLAYRAKRLAIVGDPYQLTPIVSLSDGLLKEIAQQTGHDNDDLRERGIHHKDGSAYAAFAFAARPKEPLLLNEHYRCHPQIARWFNKTFYSGELTVLTDISDTTERDRAIHWCDVDGTAKRPANGSWENPEEAEETIRQLRSAIDSGYKTIGVVTPFAAQARRIDTLAKRKFSRSKLDNIHFVSGTAHRLQGDERDAIIVSCVLSPGMSMSGARWIGKEKNLLNVAVSRARRALIVLGHPLMDKLGGPTLASLHVYIRDEAARNETTGSKSAEFRTDSISEQRLLDAMQHRDLSPYAKLEVEGYELDFALLEQGIKLNIEVDGDQHLDTRGRQRRQGHCQTKLIC